MKSIATPKVKVNLVEWDGDRSSDAGGFNIEVSTNGVISIHYGPSYNTAEEKRSALSSMRAKAKEMAKSLNVKVTEKLF